MSAKKSLLQRISKYRLRAGQDLKLGAADVSKKGSFGQQWSQPLDKINDAAHRCGEHNDLASLTCAQWVKVHLIDYAQFGRFLQNLGTVPAHDSNITPPKR